MTTIKLTPHQVLQRYLMCSYAYYIRLENLIEDSEYDSLAKFLLDHYDGWQDHQHSHLITREDLKAGTLYTIKQEDYPMVVKQAAEIWMRKKFEQERLNNEQ